MFSAEGGAVTQTVYADDVFAAWAYNGTGSAQTIVSGQNISGFGGLIKIKSRSNGSLDHFLASTARGVNQKISTNTTSGSSSAANSVTAFNTNGFTLGSSTDVNQSGQSFIAWVLRQARGFFQTVSFVGNGTTQTVGHGLRKAPGMVVIKRTDTTGDWAVWHRSATTGYYLLMNSTAAESNSSAATMFGNNKITVDPTSSIITVGSHSAVNALNGTYEVHIYAHNTDSDGLIYCSSFTTDGSGKATVAIGWEPQALEVKPTSATGNWIDLDVIRGWSLAASDNQLYPNSVIAEAAVASGNPMPGGFEFKGANSTTYVYVAFRRRNKPITSGTQIFKPQVRVGTGAVAIVTGFGFTPDIIISQGEASSSEPPFLTDRLRGPTMELLTSSQNAETAYANDITEIGMDGFTVGSGSGGHANTSGKTYTDLAFRRAAGVIEQVPYVGTGVARTVAHDLAVTPEVVMVKNRTTGGIDWATFYSDATKYLALNDPGVGGTSSTRWNNTSPTSTVFTVGTATSVNALNDQYIALLFASKAGVLKIGTYLGSNVATNIDCGFAAPARLVIATTLDYFGINYWRFAESAHGLANEIGRLTTAGAWETGGLATFATGFTLTTHNSFNQSAKYYLYLAFA